MADATLPLEYASPTTRPGRRSPLPAVVACFLVPLPFVAGLLLLNRADRPAGPPVPPGAVVAAADIRRGNAAGDYEVRAQGFMRSGRPVFHDVSVYFPWPAARSLRVHVQTFTFHPFANRVSPADHRPVTPAAMLAQMAARGCNPTHPATIELADALYADLRHLAGGTLPPAAFYTGPHFPPPDDRLLTPLRILAGWLAVSSIAAVLALRTRRPWNDTGTVRAVTAWSAAVLLAGCQQRPPDELPDNVPPTPEAARRERVKLAAMVSKSLLADGFDRADARWSPRERAAIEAVSVEVRRLYEAREHESLPVYRVTEGRDEFVVMVACFERLPDGSYLSPVNSLMSFGVSKDFRTVHPSPPPGGRISLF
jgi:hypothetical protein